MKERPEGVTFMGNPLTLVGDEIKAGVKAPDVEVLDNELAPVKISSFDGKIVVVSSVPSLDTPVCDTETRRFDDEISKLDFDVEILTISMDLPFAQKRWCGAAHAKKVKTLSDYRDASFGTSYGVLIKELRLLARAVFVLDKGRIVRYVQLIKEITNEPDYNEVLSAVKELR
jgi:thioredoxin-dependent peroxiredoxin